MPTRLPHLLRASGVTLVAVLLSCEEVEPIRVCVGTEVSRSYNTLCAVTVDGRLACWDELAVGTEPRIVVPGGVRSVQLGYNRGCYLTDTAELRCFTGAPSRGEPQATGVRSFAVAKLGALGCAVTESNHLTCWGSADGLAVPTPPDSVVSVALGELHGGCWTALDGIVRCWGVGESFLLKAANVNQVVAGSDPTKDVSYWLTSDGKVFYQQCSGCPAEPLPWPRPVTTLTSGVLDDSGRVALVTRTTMQGAPVLALTEVDFGGPVERIGPGLFNSRLAAIRGDGALLTKDVSNLGLAEDENPPPVEWSPACR